MLLSIILLNYNKPHLTLACLASLDEHFAKALSNDGFEIIIVDNASSDDSVAVLKQEIKSKKYSAVHLIENAQNDGFSKGCNIGAQKAKGEYFLFLNNDTVVGDNGIMDMVDYMQKNADAAIVGGQLTNMDGSAQSSVGSFYTPFKVFLLMTGMQKYGLLDKNPEDIAKVDWVKGGLLMIRREVFEALHGFDENIFMYTEDMELCYRAKLHGYHVYFYPHVKVLHEESGSSSRAFAIVNIYKNLLYFYKKHRPRSEYLFVKSLLRTKAVTLIGVGKVLKNSYYVQTYEKALKVI
jgi:GT2 family glycosyltransferase